MNKYKCKKCGAIIEESETKMTIEENSIGQNPNNPDEQTNFSHPVRKHAKDNGDVVGIGFVNWWLRKFGK